MLAAISKVFPYPRCQPAWLLVLIGPSKAKQEIFKLNNKLLKVMAYLYQRTFLLGRWRVSLTEIPLRYQANSWAGPQSILMSSLCGLIAT